MTRKDVEARLRRLTWPRPSPELRARVMRSAPSSERAIAWIDRVSFSRAWHWSVVVAAVMVVVIGQWLAAGPPRATPSNPALARMEALDDLVQQAGLPAPDASSLVRQAMNRRTASASSGANASRVIAGLFPAEGAPR